MNTYDLTKLSPQAFEHLVNQLAIRVLGQGHSTFGPGSDGGRDGLFEGKAPYPSETDQWSGTWYIQSKFHAPHVSADAQKWLLGEIKKELEGFKAASTRRVWPDIWIVATNIDPSGVPQTGAFDKGRSLVKTVRTKLASRFHIWGGKKILDLLAQYPDVVAYFRHFLTPGHVLTEMLDQLTDIRASADRVIRYLVVTQFEEYQYTKLEQAGSLADTRPGIHKLFIDVPFTDSKQQVSGLTLHYLVNATSQSHRHDAATSRTEDWNLWSRHPARVGIWFVRGGPGRGKSTVGQYFSQIQRAALILQNSPPYQMKPGLKAVVEDLATTARKQGFFPESPRIPILVDLKDYSAWLGKRLENQPIGVISYIADRLTTILEQPVLTGLLIRMMTLRSWFIAFDGLDEVPHDVKDTVATQVCNFLENVAIEHNFDVFALCTSRPQGYSGQFSDLYAATLDLINLSREQALACAKPVLEMERSLKESSEAYDRLYQASVSDTIQQLMTTPLQSHIMAIIVRDGEEPPDRRWLLFRTFYNVIKRRESNKKFPDPRLAKLLREDDRLLKTIHNRLGFALQARAEESVGAESFLTKDEFEKLVRNAVGRLLETDVESTVQVLLRATTERLVLVSTPEAGSQIRFDVRQLQEFFAGEFIYESVDAGTLQRRLEAVSRDSHWREVVQFCISALIEAERTTEIAIANQVLVGLNSSGEDESKDVVARMLGRGSIISARLLAEGVLEQDKRTRHQFAVSLEPFLATTNMSDIAQLVQTARPNSRTWLLEYLRNALTIRTNAENVGAALSLSLMLGDDDPLIEFVKRHLLNASMEYSAFVVTLAVLHTRTRSIAKGAIIRGRTPRWIISVLLKLLCREDWAQGQLASYAWIFSFIIDDQKHYQSVLRENNYGAAETWALKLLTQRDGSRYDQSRKRTRHPTVNGIRGVRFDRDWLDVISGTVHKDSTPSGEFQIDTGFFKIAAAISSFARMPSRDALQKVAALLRVNIAAAECLSSTGLLALVPLASERPIAPQLEFLVNMTDDDYAKLTTSKVLGTEDLDVPLIELEIESRKLSKETWKTIWITYPETAAESLSSALLALDKKKTSEAVMAVGWDDLLELWIRYPHVLSAQFALVGKLNEKLRQSSKIRLQMAIEAAVEFGPAWIAPRFQKYSGVTPFSIYPFQVSLSSERAILQLVVEVMLDGLLARERGFDGSITSQPIMDTLGSWVNGYVPDIERLSATVSDQECTLDTRLSAALLVAIHPRRSTLSISGTEHLKIALSPRRDGNIPMYLAYMISRVVSIAENADDTAAVDVVAMLLSGSRNTYRLRQTFSAVLSSWRERSNAPVTSKKLEEVWLAE